MEWLDPVPDEEESGPVRDLACVVVWPAEDGVCDALRCAWAPPCLCGRSVEGCVEGCALVAGVRAGVEEVRFGIGPWHSAGQVRRTVCRWLAEWAALAEHGLPPRGRQQHIPQRWLSFHCLCVVFCPVHHCHAVSGVALPRVAMGGGSGACLQPEVVEVEPRLGGLAWQLLVELGLSDRPACPVDHRPADCCVVRLQELARLCGEHPLAVRECVWREMGGGRSLVDCHCPGPPVCQCVLREVGDFQPLRARVAD